MRSDIHTFSLLVWIQSSDRNVVLFTFWPGSVFSNCNSLHNVTGAASHQWPWFSLPFFLFISLAEYLHLKQFLVSYCFYYKSQPNFNSLFTVFVPFFSFFLGARPSSTAPSPPTWPSPKPHRSLGSGPTAGPTLCTAWAFPQSSSCSR